MIAVRMDHVPLPWLGGYALDAVFVAPSEKEARALLTEMFEPWPSVVNEIMTSFALESRTSVRTWYIQADETTSLPASLRSCATPDADVPECHLVTCTVGEFLDALPATGMRLFRHTE